MNNYLVINVKNNSLLGVALKDFDILNNLVFKSERTLYRMEAGYYDKKRTD